MKNKVSELTSHEKKICSKLYRLFSLFVVDKEAEERLAVRYSEELALCYPLESDITRFEKAMERCVRGCKRFPSVADILEVGAWQDLTRVRY